MSPIRRRAAVSPRPAPRRSHVRPRAMASPSPTTEGARNGAKASEVRTSTRLNGGGSWAGLPGDKRDRSGLQQRHELQRAACGPSPPSTARVPGAA